MIELTGADFEQIEQETLKRYISSSLLDEKDKEQALLIAKIAARTATLALQEYHRTLQHKNA
jgi:hypothetical protein